jgi:hypothetical protein
MVALRTLDTGQFFSALLGLAGEASKCRFVKIRHLGAKGQRGSTDAESLPIRLKRHCGLRA